MEATGADYFATVAAHFITRRGRGLTLSSADLEIISAWEREGIPLGVVLRGIDDAFRRRPGDEIRSLAQCRWTVAAEVERARLVGPGGKKSMDTHDIEKTLAALAAALTRAGRDVGDPAMAAALEAAARKVRDLAVAPGANAGARLKTIESELLDALSASLAPEEMAALDVAAARGVREEDAHGRAREEALHAKVRETVRGLFDLPAFRIG